MDHLCQGGFLMECISECIALNTHSKALLYGHRMPSLMSPYPFMRYYHYKSLEF